VFKDAPIQAFAMTFLNALFLLLLPILIIGHRYTGRMEAHGDGPMAAVPPGAREEKGSSSIALP